ncbi:hypothetical protein BDV28DRAFT_132919 [Aspergillus coremiiformis]|uniref:Store-operated calcium entry-associated regulatory factor n=1 Tax=Aspergillus coremiiformis TaxID=138285 RepID=A0A5N6Z7D2_9EURO|nr:hypothetical protein BDV28DRAFT_132919 [Aspergillus coremiiformis]
MYPMYPMILQAFLLFLLPISVLSDGRYPEKPPGNNAILLSRVQMLTLHGNRFTTARRVDPIPQLTCTGPSQRICDMYPIDVMRCTNAGYDYDEEDVQWTCTASLPQEFKLGSTDVVCEGYRNADDKWVLKGSCGVEYRLLLTELGEQKFGRVREETRPGTPSNNGLFGSMAFLGDLLFFSLMAVVFIVILWALCQECSRSQGNRRGRTYRHGGGGGDNGGGGPYPGPPPPYTSCPDTSSSSSASTRQGWRPGFWTGALGGAAAGYEYGRRSGSRHGSSFASRQTTSNSRWNNAYDPGEGSSRSRSPQFSAPTTSTGFGSTRRR